MNPKHLTHQISTSYVCEMQVSNPKHKVYNGLKETDPGHELLCHKHVKQRTICEALLKRLSCEQQD